jgi:hypothetical protein
MSLRFSRVVIIVVLLSTWLIGGFAVSGPIHGAAKSGDFSGASNVYKVLKQSGTFGTWYVPSLNNGAEVNCFYPTSTSQYHVVKAQFPWIYPAADLASQSVKTRVTLYQRSPGGGLYQVDYHEESGTATSSAPFKDPTILSFYGDLGSTYVIVADINWYTNGSLTGSAKVLYLEYLPLFNGSILPAADACYPQMPAYLLPQGGVDLTVGSSTSWVHFIRMPSGWDLSCSFDGTFTANCGVADSYGSGKTSYIVPAVPMGYHTLKIYRLGRSASVQIHVHPRIKVIPNYNLHRGDIVNVSLRGYAAHETVAIRWLKSGSWVTVGSVTTSSTGSANINVKVPIYAVIGTNSVRGDGTYGHAQTNAVEVTAVAASLPKPSSSPEPTETATPAPTSTPVVKTATSQPTTTVQPTEPAVTETAIPTEAPATETATAQPTETATPTIDPTEEQASPTETPTVEPTVDQTETVTP